MSTSLYFQNHFLTGISNGNDTVGPINLQLRTGCALQSAIDKAHLYLSGSLSAIGDLVSVLLKAHLQNLGIDLIYDRLRLILQFKYLQLNLSGIGICCPL